MVSDKVYQVLLDHLSIIGSDDIGRFMSVVKQIKEPESCDVLESLIHSGSILINKVIFDAFTAEPSEGIGYCEETLAEDEDPLRRMKAASILYAVGNQAGLEILEKHYQVEEDKEVRQTIDAYLRDCIGV